MFIISKRPNWEPGDGQRGIQSTIEEAEEFVKNISEPGEVWYIREAWVGAQIKYAAVLTISGTAYPEEG